MRSINFATAAKSQTQSLSLSRSRLYWHKTKKNYLSPAFFLSTLHIIYSHLEVVLCCCGGGSGGCGCVVGRFIVHIIFIQLEKEEGEQGRRRRRQHQQQ